MEGWVKIHRSILNWQWWQDDNMVRLFLYLIISANFEDKKWRDITVRRGQIVTTRKQLSEVTKISEQSIRTCLDRLETSQEITRQITNKYTIITICKFDTYQVKEETRQPTTNQQLTNNQPTTNQQNRKKGSPHTPFKERYIQELKNSRNYYYSSNRAHTREEQEQKEFFFIFWLKGSKNPKAEVDNFITWNRAPEKVAAWEKYSETDRYELAEKRWVIKGDKLPGWSEKAGNLLMTVCKIMRAVDSDFCKNIFINKRFPFVINNDKLTVICTEEIHSALEMHRDILAEAFQRTGITETYYKTFKRS